MEHLINIGLIVCGNNWKDFNIDRVATLNGYRVKKIFTTDSVNTKIAHNYYPLAEFTNDAISIMEDTSIPLVILTNPGFNENLDIASLALQHGKQVRTV